MSGPSSPPSTCSCGQSWDGGPSNFQSSSPRRKSRFGTSRQSPSFIRTRYALDCGDRRKPWPWACWERSDVCVTHRSLAPLRAILPEQLAKTCTVEQRLLANEAFSVLSKAWDSFRNENGM
jgi:hypothetical protein